MRARSRLSPAISLSLLLSLASPLAAQTAQTPPTPDGVFTVYPGEPRQASFRVTYEF